MNLRYKKPLRIDFIKYTALSVLNPHRSSLHFGLYGLQFITTNFLTYKQLNTVRVKISRGFKQISNRFYKIYLRIFFPLSITRKPGLSRMGKGSGQIIGWLSIGKPGHVFLELNTLALNINIKALLMLGKLGMPIDYAIVIRSTLYA